MHADADAAHYALRLSYDDASWSFNLYVFMPQSRSLMENALWSIASPSFEGSAIGSAYAAHLVSVTAHTCLRLPAVAPDGRHRQCTHEPHAPCQGGKDT